MDERWWRREPEGIVVSIRATPNGRRNQLLGVGDDDHLRLRLRAPAVDDQANEELKRYVAELFGIRRSAVRIVRGRRSRIKQVRIVGLEAPPPDLLERAGRR